MEKGRILSTTRNERGSPTVGTVEVVPGCPCGVRQEKGCAVGKFLVAARGLLLAQNRTFNEKGRGGAIRSPGKSPKRKPQDK